MPTLASLYRTMVRVRRLNDDAIALQRQGSIYGFAPCTGQEAAQVGSAAALDPARDFAFPTYREFGAMIALGIDPVALLAHHRGYADGGAFDAATAHVAPMNAVVGGTALHAVGWALGARLDGDEACALAYFGDGASSQGEVHEAMNFAAVFRAPVVFLCQSNGWAISLPTEKQVAGGSVAARAQGYGMPGVQVDGNDVLAVYEATAGAARRARAGEGPSVVEAMTYRLGPHATSDDPSRYRTAEEEEAWRAREPIARTAASLREQGASEEILAEIDAAAQAEALDVRERFAALSAPTLREQLDLAYERTPPAIRAGTEAWLEAGAVHA
jgi:2-oxoisovalerate dehydrogenase E1 component alpha subunit